MAGPGEQRGGSSDSFVGRAAELAVLHAALDEALRGAARVVTVCGEPGIGKTRTTAHLSHAARERGMTPLTGYCLDQEGAPPLWPWVQILRRFCEAPLDDALRSVDAATIAVLATLVPEAARLLPDRPPAVSVAAPEAARFRLFDAVAQTLRRIARPAPLLLLFEDMHWSDVASLLLLRFLLRQDLGVPLLVALTYRDAEVRRSDDLQPLLREIERLPGARPVRLGGLPESECRELAARLAAPPLDHDAHRRIWNESRGNPLFVQELVRGLAEHAATRGAIAAPPVAVPDALRDVIRQRLARLSGTARGVLGAASVIGRELNLALLVRLTTSAGLSDGAELADALDEGLQHGIIERESARVRFSHDLVREALYGDLRGSERIRLHECAGRALEYIYAGALESHFSELAHHYYEAALGGTAEKAVRYSRRAAELTHALPAFEEAAAHYRKALQALDMCGNPCERERCELLLGLGDAIRLASGGAAAMPHLREAVRIARQAGDAELFGRAVALMRGLIGRIGEPDLEYVRLVEEALGRLPATDSELRIELGSRLVFELLWTARRTQCEALVGEMVEMARRLGTPAALARALNAAHAVLYRPDNPDERLGMADELVVHARAAGDRYYEAAAHVWRAVDLVELGRMAEAEEAIEANGRVVAHLHSPYFDWQAAVLGVLRCTVAGRLAQAESLAVQALQIGAEQPNSQLVFGTQVFALRWLQGRLGEAEFLLRASIGSSPAAAPLRAALAFVLCEQDKHEEASAELEILAADDFAAIPPDSVQLHCLALLAEVCTQLGDAARAKLLYEILAPYRDRIILVSTGCACYGAVGYFHGGLAMTLGFHDRARQSLEAALAVHERMGARPFRALTQYRLATLLARGESDEARGRALQLLEQARQAAVEMGMMRLVELCGRLDIEPPSTRGAADRQSSRRAVARIEEPCLFRRDGEFWSIGDRARPVRIPDALGLEYIAHLLAHAGREILAVDLAQLEVGTGEASSVRGETAIVAVADLGDAGEMLDPQARAAYRRRVEELREELAEAEQFNDTGRAERARAEIELLGAELSRAVGLGGRDRKAASHAERARINVTRAIKKALAQIARYDAALAHHLTTAIRTGRYCSYVPDPERPVRWEIG